MTDLKRVLLIIEKYGNDIYRYPTSTQIIKDFDWNDEVSPKVIRRLLKSIEFFVDNEVPYTKKRKLYNELKLLSYMSRHWAKDYFYSSEQIIYEIFKWDDLENHVSVSQLRKYIRDIRNSGVNIITKPGRKAENYRGLDLFDKGYCLEQRIPYLM